MAGSQADYAESLAISRKMALHDATDSRIQRNIGVALSHLANLGAPGVSWVDALAVWAAMDKAGTLQAPDRPYLDEARKHVGRPGA